MSSQLAPLVSILLPTHNRSETLGPAIESLLGQTMGDFELFVVGDGCTDESAEVVRSFRDGRVIWMDLPKVPGFGYANRNHALSRARGRFLAYLGHDDLALPDHLEQLLGCFDDEAVHLAYSRPLWVMPDGRIIPGTINLHELGARQLFLARQQNAIPACCVMYRDPAIPKRHDWNAVLEKQGDWDLWIRVLQESPGGPERALCYHPVPTSLHFTANWRTMENAGPPEAGDWLKLHEQADLLPSELRLGVPEGALEQRVFWDAMRESTPELWTRELRRSVAQAIDIFCAFGGHDQRPLYERLEKAQERARRLRKEVDTKSARIEHLLAKIAEQKGPNGGTGRKRWSLFGRRGKPPSPPPGPLA